MLDRAMIKEIPHALASADPPPLFVQADIVGELLFRFVTLRVAVWTIYRPFRDSVCLRLIHQIRHPCRDGLDYDLCSLALQEFKHVEVSVAFRDLRPKFTGDFYHGLYASAVNFDWVQSVLGTVQRVQVI